MATVLLGLGCLLAGKFCYHHQEKAQGGKHCFLLFSNHPTDQQKKTNPRLIHTRKLRWNLKITLLKRNIILKTSICWFHVSFQGCRWNRILTKKHQKTSCWYFRYQVPLPYLVIWRVPRWCEFILSVLLCQEPRKTRPPGQEIVFLLP